MTMVVKNFNTARGTHTEKGTVIKMKGGGKVFSSADEFC